MSNMVELQIAAASLRGRFVNEGALPDRIKAAMVAVRKAPEQDVFWMCGRVDDDMKFCTALAAVMLQGDDDDREMVTRSMRPLQALSAAAQGIPVDFASLLSDADELIPLMKLWHETGEEKP